VSINYQRHFLGIGFLS